jgi:protein-disulfide isomerase
MNNSWLKISGLVMTLCLSLLVMSGCQPPPCECPSEVRPTGQNGEDLSKMVESLEGELTRIESQYGGNKSKPQLDKSKVNKFDLTNAPVLGKADAPFTVVAFSDFQCPFCKKFAEAGHKIVEDFPDKIKVVFMNFPLDNKCNDALNRPFHKDACMASYAAMAANEEGKFWEMHDFIFSDYRSISKEKIVDFAKSKGMDHQKIQEAIETEKYKELLKAQAKQLLPTGSRGTPTVFVNGMKANNVRWDNPSIVKSFFQDVVNPKKEETASKIDPAIDNAGALSAAQVFLADGTRLEDRLTSISERLKKIQTPTKPKRDNKPKGPDPMKVYSFNKEGSPLLGPKDAPVSIVVFSNFTCPHCSKAGKLVTDIQKKFEGKVNVIFKHLANPRQEASMAAHEGGAIANESGKFWELHDMMFENQRGLNAEKVREYAEKIGLDMVKYDKAVADGSLKKKAFADNIEANKLGIQSTPTIFINGRYQRNRSMEAFETAINEELKKAGK